MNLGQKCHFIGIGGVGMSGLARLLLQRHLDVSGSDLSANYITENLVKEGAEIKIGHAANHICQGMTVIYTTGIANDNPELAEAIKCKCTMLHRSDLLYALMDGHQTLAIAGTHGKTTTSALLASVLAHAGADPTFAIGGTLNEFSSNARKGEGPYFVAEACESDGTFTKYKPYGAILTNIDLDHMDFFGSESALITAFADFVSKVSQQKHLFWCGDDKRLRSIISGGVSYGYGERCDLRIINQKQIGWNTVFDCTFKGKVYERIQQPLVGRHNILNAAAVFGLCLTLGIPEEAIRNGLIAFQGVQRRCEKKGEVVDVLVIDDYAHHPTEIATTLYGIRKAVGERKLVAVFQPHRYSRTKDCLGLFKNAFDAADEVVVTDIYSAGEPPIHSVNGQLVADEIAGNFRARVHYMPKDKLLEYMTTNVRPHDVVVTLGAGDLTKLGNELIQKFQAQPPKKWRVGVVFGGRSLEHEVSLLSAKNVIESLNPQIYEIELFGIHKDGKWVKCSNSFDELKVSNTNEAVISADVLHSLLQCDVFFPVLHGPYGEDGTLQGFFDTLGKAYVGCDHRSAAICMDKALTKKIASLHNIAVVPFLSFTEYEWREQSEIVKLRIKQDLRYPVFVKPLHLGSTVGISKVNSVDLLEDAIEAAFRVDTAVLVENGLQIRELEFAVMGNDHAETFPPGEILTGGRVYDYEGKYDDFDPIKATPRADISEGVLELGLAWAKKAYLAAECKGMARVDFFLDDEGQLWLNEINPIPGFTTNSLYPQICAANGIACGKLADRLIILALQRKRLLQRSLENI